MDKPKVLIVDDEIEMRIFLSALFETNGYLPETSRDGRTGLEKARETVPDLIILDVMMPGEGGVAMYQELKTDERLRAIPVMVLSAVAAKTFAHYLKMLSAQLPGGVPDPDAYVEKPPDAAVLLDLARQLIKRPGPGGAGR
jgi:CheY-like chemotaxis protein